MSSSNRCGITAIVALLLCIASSIGRADAGETRWGADYFPKVTLTTQDGQTVRFYEDLLKDKIVAIDLIYTTCKYACPLETARLAQVQAILGDRMGRDVFFYSITIDPEHDTPQVLKEYAQKFKAGPGWLFLTGKAADIEAISRKLGLYSEPNPANKDGHTPTLVVGNVATGQWMRNSALDNPRFLATTIGNWMNSWKESTPGRSYVEAGRLTIDPGRYAFTTHCAPCHTIGEGRKVGPDLAGVTTVRERQWLERFIISPQQMLTDRDPTAVALYEQYKPLQMPNLSMSSKDAGAIIDYIAARSVALGRPTVAPAGAVPIPPAATKAGPTTSADAASAAGDSTMPPIDVMPLIEPYLRVQAALSGDSLDGVSSQARAMTATVAAARPAPEPVRSALQALAAATTLQDARTAFGNLGDAIMAAAQASHASLGGEVHVAYCPMARKSWLQKGTEIRNPFYGKAMLDCGRIVNDALPDGR
jgi:protein SCO1